MSKKNFFKTAIFLTVSFIISFVISCSIGLGDAVDTDAPTIEISYPPKNAVVRDTFVLAGTCNDDLALDSVSVTVTNTSTKKEYGPYPATLNEEKTEWTVSLNKKQSGKYDPYNSYKQWEFPDGNYVLSAVAYDESERASQASSIPVSIDNTAPVLLVSKPLAFGAENATVYGRTLNIIGDISEEHETKRLTLYYREFDTATNSFKDSEARTLEINGFGTMSSDNPLTIAKYEGGDSKLTQNYVAIYNDVVDLTRSNKKMYYCGFLLEDNAKLYSHPGDSGEAKGNETTQYYILSDEYNTELFSESTYSLNARNLMLLLNGQSSYSDQQISRITEILKKKDIKSVTNASSTELTKTGSSKFSLDPKNNPVWSITNFGMTDGIFRDYELGSAVPLVLKSGGDGIPIDPSTIEIKLYHVGNGTVPGTINENTPWLTLVPKGSYEDGKLKEAINQSENDLVFSDGSKGLKVNHFYEIVVTGEDKPATGSTNGNSIESEGGIRYGFKRYSNLAAPTISFTYDSTDSTILKENEYYKGDDLENGIRIKGSIVTANKDIKILSSNDVSVTRITRTRTDISNSASSTEIKNYTLVIEEPSTWVASSDGSETKGKEYLFTALITGTNLKPSEEGCYKYKVAFVAIDENSGKNDPVEFEFNVDNKAPVLPEQNKLLIVPSRKMEDGKAYVNGIIDVSGNVSDEGKGFKELWYKIIKKDGTLVKNYTKVSGADLQWELNNLNTRDIETDENEKCECSLWLKAVDQVGNETEKEYSLNVWQATDRPEISITNEDVIFTTTNNKVVCNVTDDDGISKIYYKWGDASAFEEITDFTSGTTSHSFSIDYSEDEGVHILTVKVEDSAGLDTGTKEITKELKKDNGAPKLNIDSVSTYNKSGFTITGSVEDGSNTAEITRKIYKVTLENGSEKETAVGTEAQISADKITGSIKTGASWSDDNWIAQIPADANGSIQGTYRIYYTAKDSYAETNEGHETRKSVTFKIDNVVPKVSSIKIDGHEIIEWYNKNSGKLTVEASDDFSDISSVQYAIGTDSWNNMSKKNDKWEAEIIFDETELIHTLKIKAIDNALNPKEETRTIQIDMKEPSLEITGLESKQYVNGSQDIEFSGNCKDGENESGFKQLSFMVGTSPVPENKRTLTRNETTSAFSVKLDKSLFTKESTLTVIAEDNAGNKYIETPCTIVFDNTPPSIDENLVLSITNGKAYKKEAGKYFVNRGTNKEGVLSISGTASDPDENFNKIKLSIKTKSASNSVTVLEKEETASTWTFTDSEQKLKNQSGELEAVLTAYDKAGNSDEVSFTINFDETGPVIVTGECPDDRYYFRGERVFKFNNLKIGEGTYSKYSYGRLSSIDFEAWLNEEESGIAGLEYRLYGADGDKTFAELNFDDNTIQWAASGKFKLESNKSDYSYYDSTVGRTVTGSGIKATASISGFKTATGDKTNYLLLCPVDNCNNQGDITILEVHVDQTAPTTIAENKDYLTNGTKEILLTGNTYDVDAGLKALRVFINGKSVFEVSNTDTTKTNEYGTFTCSGYAAENPKLANPITDSTALCLLRDAANYVHWELTITPDAGANNSWFDKLVDELGDAALIPVEIQAEDWAEYKGKTDVVAKGNINTLKVASLRLDTDKPKVKDVTPETDSKVNDEVTIKGSTSDNTSSPAEVSLYYVKSDSANDPANGYKLIKTLSTSGTNKVDVSELYNFSFTVPFYGKDSDNEKFIEDNASSQPVWLKIVAKDEAGNESDFAPFKYIIDRDSDRPVITLEDIDLSKMEEGDYSKVLLKNQQLFFTISDDDGEVLEAKYRTKKKEDEDYSDFKDISLSGGNFTLENDGQQIIEFQVKDAKGKVFSTVDNDGNEETKIWNKVMIDGTSLPSLYATIDNHSPEISIEKIRGFSKKQNAWDTDWTDNDDFIKTIGGDTTKLQFKVKAEDAGSGIKDIQVELKNGETPVTPANQSDITVTPDTDNYYIVELPCNVAAWNGVFKVKVIANDKAERSNKAEKTFNIDNTKPAITVSSPAEDSEQSGSITAFGGFNERVYLSYAISPLEEDPDNYKEPDNNSAGTSFNFKKKNSNTGIVTEEALPAKNKAGTTITLPAGTTLMDLCKYHEYDTEQTNSFYIYFDDLESLGANHTGQLNTWLYNLGITIDTDVNNPDITKCFDDIVTLYLHLKAEDAAGNSEHIACPILIDPQGNRPKIEFSYPKLESSTLGGKINLIGSVSGKTSSYDVYLQIDNNNDGNYETSLDGYTLESIPNLAGQKGIKIHINGTVWSKKINENGEFNPPANQDITKPINIRVYAVDENNLISSAKTRHIEIDNLLPVIDPDVKLVQWVDGKTAADGITGVTNDSEQNISLNMNTVKALRSYSDGISLAGKWFVVGKVTDESGISKVTKDGDELSSTPKADGSFIKAFETTVVEEGVSKTVTNYIFCFPIGSDETEIGVGESVVAFSATDGGTEGNEKTLPVDFSVKYDNKAPQVLSLSDNLEIINSNGLYEFGSEAYENSIMNAGRTVNQTGVERVAFYFTRTINSTTTVFDPMYRPSYKNEAGETVTTGNALPVSGFTEGEEGFLWKSVSVNSVNEYDITVSGTLPSFVHIGGLAKVNGTIYRIENIIGSVVTLSERPGTATAALFTVANVIDGTIPEIIQNNSETFKEDYGYGYPKKGDEDDDLMPETFTNTGSKYNWNAKINSKNISDGPVTLHYIVFDKAGNYTSKEVGAMVQNNSPRLAGTYIGTDEDGNGTVDSKELKSYSDLFKRGYKGNEKVTKLTIPQESTDASPVKAIKIKRLTVIKPEIVGGNGKVGYTYKVAKRNGSSWDTLRDILTSPSDLGDGKSDDTLVDLKESGGIKIEVKDFLNNGIKDGISKFSFTIWDSTPGLEYGRTSQNATLDVIMDVALNDKTPATNKIIPFYWKNKDNNSLAGNSTSNGHIELTQDLLSASFDSNNTGIYDLDPKVSGAFNLEGIAQDDSLLKNLYVTINNGTEKIYHIGTYENGAWEEKTGTYTSEGKTITYKNATITQATFGEFMAAGYITALPEGKNADENVPYASQEYGHVVHWTLEINTEVMGINPKENVLITVSAEDMGTPYDAEGNPQWEIQNVKAKYTSNDFTNNGDGDTPGQTGESKYTCKYKIDVVPYIRGIKTKLSTKSKKSDSSEYDRTARGHYPVANTEVIYLYGFNLKGTANGKLYDKAGTNVTLGNSITIDNIESYQGYQLYATAADAIKDFTSGPVYVTVDGIKSLNNENDNNAKGSYTDATFTESLTETEFTTAVNNLDANGGNSETYLNFYNRKPNAVNNNVLTDDIELDVWEFNSQAAKPYSPGVISDPVMKINPSNAMIGFAYNSPRAFSMATDEYSYIGYLGGFDNFTAGTFAYDGEGNTFGTTLGGDINKSSSVSKFSFMSSLWGSSGMNFYMDKKGGKHLRIEQIGQIGTKADKSPAGSNSNTNAAGNYIDKTRVLSPSIAVSGSGTDANVYLAYYDHLNEEIRFRWASKPNASSRGFSGNNKYIVDTYTNSTLGNHGAPDKYYTVNAQIIAEDNCYTYEDSGIGKITTSNSLGNAGPYVDIAVLPSGSTGNNEGYDIVVLVWYDATSKELKYTYNSKNLANQSADDFGGSTNTKQYWTAAKTIFTEAGQYCKIAVDGNGGIHIAGYDKDAGDVRYAKISKYDDDDIESCIVDANGIVGTNITLDVALDAAGGNAIPYIGYYGDSGPKFAYLTAEAAAKTSLSAGSTANDTFTGAWEITEIPTPSKAPKDRVNVGVWKKNGVLAWSTTDFTENGTVGTPTVPYDGGDDFTKHSTANYNQDNPGDNDKAIDTTEAITYGNGTKNAVLAYEIRPTSAKGFIETAQMQ